MALTVIVSAVIACGAGLVLTALARRLAPRFGLVDRPDGHRKLHGRATPLGGGLAVILATTGVIGVLMAVPNPFHGDLHKAMPGLPILLLAGAVIVLVGLVDDRVKLRGRYKLLGQLLSVTILIAGGLVINEISIFHWEIKLGLLAIPFTVFWLLGAINSLNLLDGIDGLAATVGIILASTIAAMAIVADRPPEVALVAIILAASLLGFLRFNFPPAKVFLGDAGSMFIGLMVGALSIQGSLKGPGTVLLAAPLAVWTIPIFDCAAAIARRTLTGRSISVADRAHLHHHLLVLLRSNRRVLVWIGLSCAVTSAAAMLSVMLKNDLLAVITSLAVVMLFVVSGTFGRVELLLVGMQIRRLGRALMPANGSQSPDSHHAYIHFQGSRMWEPLWKAFTESVDTLGLDEVRLDINLPVAQEGCHAVWEKRSRGQPNRYWHLKVPLVVGNEHVGWVKVVGEHSNSSTCRSIKQLVAMIEPFHEELSAVAGGPPPVAEHLSRSAVMEQVYHE